ncbi:hypothetical protein SADUNF_Sadunf03G0034600 [Salix dunnii]|uniref:Uncharacterized protein n=1 Tax=Salix dunnii TaxID=1413687 RepID=A0A835KGZ4_9ROSI|nr:hypothetical protein SADUNF_Sadunf03G0034600 [Salix dunnii]
MCYGCSTLHIKASNGLAWLRLSFTGNPGAICVMSYDSTSRASKRVAYRHWLDVLAINLQWLINPQLPNIPMSGYLG